MAQIVKAKKKQELVDIEQKNENIKKNDVKNTKAKNKDIKIEKEQKNSLWTKFMIFCHGIKSEISKVRWTNKQDMIKYSVATIVFVVFCSLFFYGIDFIFALIQSIVKGV